MKSIRSKIMLCMTATIMVAVLLVGIISASMSYSSTVTTLEQTMTETAKVTAERVEHELNTYAQIAYEIGSLSTLASRTTSVRDKQTILDQRMEIHGFIDAGIIGSDGLNALDKEHTVDYSNTEYFQRALQGETMITPYISGDQLIVLISAPLWANGVPGGEAIGAVYFVPNTTFLNDIVTSIEIGDNGGAYIIDASGTTIAHKNMQSVLNQENTIEDAKTDSSLADLAAMEQKMINGETGSGTYTYGGVKKLLAYAPISGTDGWSIGVNVPVSDFTGPLVTSLVITGVIAVISLIAATSVAYGFSVSIGKPLKLCAQRLQDMAEGDLHTEVPPVRTKDEIGQLLAASASLREDFENIISDIKYLMGEMSHGNFIIKTDHREYYRGDYAEILLSMRNLRDNMDDTLKQIDAAAVQVDSGSDQVANGAQALSQGATEQAASVEELAATVNEINRNAADAGDYANQASLKTGEAGNLMTQCAEQMEDMLSAMDEINRTSEEIGKIIKTIEDIAFQTNILALNAAVEAARAGAAGKGFAVVADEVRNLAAKSAEASKNTSALIEASMLAVEKGAKLANGTAEQLQAVTESAQVVMGMVSKIAANAQEQTAALQQVSTGIDQISAVVQTNSATAEESAAASEELSSQAQMLKDLIGRFKLEEEALPSSVQGFSFDYGRSADEEYAQPVENFAANYASKY